MILRWKHLGLECIHTYIHVFCIWRIQNLVKGTTGCGLSHQRQNIQSKFHIHMSVHYKYNSRLQPIRCNVSWFIYFYRRSTCFRRFFHPSSGAHNCTYSFGYCRPILLLAAIVDEMECSSISSVSWYSNPSHGIQSVSWYRNQFRSV